MPNKALFRIDELAPLATYLHRFAVMKLRDDDLAREAVQETFLAALENRSSFAGKSTLKTWLTAILKFKIVDLIRRQAREPAFSPLLDIGAEGNGESPEHEYNPFTQAAPVWESPEAAFEEKEFWSVFEAGVATLPTKTQRVFLMRDVLGHTTQEICKELAITETNCWVILHRARLGMRQYLSENWFNKTGLEYGENAKDLPGDFPNPVAGTRSRTYARGVESTETTHRTL